jgi:leucyl aminopeptidase (aminopeptidase T)
VYSPILIVNFLAIFCKNIFYDEKISRPIGFCVGTTGCDDGNLIQEDINFQDMQVSCTTKHYFR